MDFDFKDFLKKRWYFLISLVLFLGVIYLNVVEDTKNVENPYIGDIFFFQGPLDKKQMPYQVAGYDNDSINFYVSNFIKFDVNHVRDYNFDNTQFNRNNVVRFSRKQVEALNKNNFVSIPVITKLRER